MNDDLRWRIRFGRVFADRLAAEGIDARDWLLFHPHEETLRLKDETIFEVLDPKKSPHRWNENFADSAGTFPADIAGRVVPELRRRFVLLLVGGLGSHLVSSRIFEELAAHNAPVEWIHHIDYGNTLSSNVHCAERAASACRAVLSRPDAEGKQILFWGHSKGANIILELLTQPRYADLRARTWGAVSFAGAIGGSPAADSLLARTVKRSRGLPRFLRSAARTASHWIARLANHPLAAGLPTLGDLPDGVQDLSQKRRHAFLNRLALPPEIRFLSVAAAIERERAKPKKFFSRDFDRRFLYLSTYELARHSALNDTQLLLPDAKWPPGPNVHHLATIHTDHWGLVYRQVLPGAKPDPTPRLALTETALALIYEMALEEE